jgi:hypothetical protein
MRPAMSVANFGNFGMLTSFLGHVTYIKYAAGADREADPGARAQGRETRTPFQIVAGERLVVLRKYVVSRQP